MEKKPTTAKADQKDVKVIAIGLIVMLVITAGIVHGDRILARKAAQEIYALRAVIDQNDALVKNLARQLKAARDEVKAAKAEIDDANIKLGAVKTIVDGQSL